MEYEPKSVDGKRVQILLNNFVSKSAEGAVEKLKRIFIFWASKVRNEDSFLGALYGQDALDETPLNLRKQLPTDLLRVQYAMEICSDRKKVKELVVALEMSENENILKEIVKWTQNSVVNVVQAAKKDQNSPVEEALRNSLILHRIYAYFPNEFLLSACSLVNKNWNTEARTFIRDYRNCTARQHTTMSKSTCEYLSELDQLCEQMTRNGRVIPWNSLRIVVCEFDPRCKQPAVVGQSAFANLIGNLTLKHLDISWRHDCQCRVHTPLSTLLFHKSAELKTLEITALPSELPKELNDWQPYFPNLIKVTILAFTNRLPGQNPIVQKAIARNIMQGAPKLKTVFTSDLTALEAVPEDMYGLLIKLDFYYGGVNDQHMFYKIAEKGPQLETLFIKSKRDDPYDEDRDNEIFSAQELRRKLDPVLERLLRQCSKSLKQIVINGWNPLSLFSFPPLVNLTSLSIEKPYRASINGLWNSIRSIDYSRLMPALCYVNLAIETIEPWRDDCEEGIASLEWPEPDENGFHHGSSSTRELSLKLQVGIANMPLIQAVFPNLSVLSLSVIGGAAVGVDLFPNISSIWELWPRLTEFRINGFDNTLERNFDAEFCGIYEEEAELLQEMDEEYLEAVHIVPIRPSVLTMPCLKTLAIDLTFEDPMYSSGRRLTFISAVTDGVALSKMSAMNVSVSWNFEISESDVDNWQPNQYEYDEDEDEFE